MQYVNKMEVQQALKKAAAKDHKTWLIIKVLAETGVRVSELIAITPRDINDDNTLSVTGKGSKHRIIDIPGELVLQLRLFIKNNKIKPKNALFPYTCRNIGYITHAIIDKNPHAFRHGYAIQLLRKTKNIRYLQKQLGHSKLDTTQIYLQFMEFDEEKEKLAGMYNDA
jgi:integrase